MTESPQPQSEKLAAPASESIEPKPNSRKALVRWGIAIAAVAHIVIFIVLFVIPNFRGDVDSTAEKGGTDTGSSEDGGPESNRPKRPDVPISQDPKWEDPVKDLIDDAIKNHENLTDEQKQSELEDQLKKLNRISSPENVEKITKHLAPLVTGHRKTQPVENLPEVAKDQPSFDHDSAQVHDVVKTEKDGKTIFIATLLDKDGRTMETELTAAEGESLHNTFQLIKKSPMLEKIYRSVVMGTLDRLLNKKPKADEGESKEVTPSEPDTEEDLESPEVSTDEANS